MGRINTYSCEYYPIFLDLKGLLCVVVGGGEVAERKVNMLVKCGAQVRVISPQLNEGLKVQASQGVIQIATHLFEPRDLEGAFLAISATNNREINNQVAAEAKRRSILVNVVDAPSQGNFIVPSVVHRGDLAIAISTSGKSPALARKLRQELERDFAPAYASLLEVVSQVRQDFLAQGKHVAADAWQASLDGELLELVRQGKMELAQQMLVASLEKRNKPT